MTDSFTKELTGEQFKQLFKQPIAEEGEGFRIENIIVTDAVNLSDIQIDKPVFIHKCIFFESVKIEFSEFSRKMILSQSEFQSTFTISSGIFERSIAWINCTLKKVLTISGGKYEDDFLVNDGSFREGIAVYGGDFLKGFKINKGRFNRRFRIYGGRFQSFVIEDGYFREGCKINGGIFEKDVVISKGSFKQELRIERGVFTSIRIAGKEGSLKTTKKLYINQLIISTPISCPVTINEAKIASLTFGSMVQAAGLIKLYNLDIQDIKFNGFTNFGVLRISSLLKTTENTVLKLVNSDLGNCEMYDLDFESFRAIEYQNTNLLCTKIFSDSFKENKTKVKTLRSDSHFSSLSEYYNQLYKISKISGTRHKEIYYYKKYMDSQLMMLSKESDHKQNAMILSLKAHKITSDYGTNWIRATMWLSIISILCFLCYSLSIISSYNLISLKHLTISNILFYSGEYFEFINPLRKFHTIGNLELTAVSKIIDFFSRVLMAFLIYQIVSSFRRFGK